MSIITGVIESLLSDAIKNGIKENKGCFGCLFIMLGLLALSFFIFVVWVMGADDRHETVVWKNVGIGDSLFVESAIIGVDFYKKGRTKLNSWEQREIKYAREDTVSFERINSVPEKYFYRNKTSFIGICIGLDSTATSSGNKWLMIKPTYSITHPPKPKDEFDFEIRKWNKPLENYEGFRLSREFYVKASDVLLENNDITFK